MSTLVAPRLARRAALCTVVGAALAACQDHQAPAENQTVPRFTVSVGGGGTASGRVTSADGQIDCTLRAGVATGSCSATFAQGASVRLAAQGSSASEDEFGGWSGASCAGSVPSCVVVVDGNVAVVAAFRPQRQTLTLSVVTPHADDGAFLVSVAGPGILAVRPDPKVELSEARDTVAGVVRARLFVRGALSSGAVAQFDVPGGAAASQYTLQMLQAAARASGRYAQRTDLALYALTLR